MCYYSKKTCLTHKKNVRPKTSLSFLQVKKEPACSGMLKPSSILTDESIDRMGKYQPSGF